MIYSVSIHVALALKGIDYDYKSVHLLQDGGQQVGVRQQDSFAQGRTRSIERLR